MDGPRYAQCTGVPEARSIWIAENDASVGKTAWNLTHVDAEGRRTSFTVKALTAPQAGAETADGQLQHALTPAFPFDFDGDGEPELLFLQVPGSYDAGFPGLLLTAKGGKAEAFYVPPEGYFIQGVDDVDGDGRPDLTLQLIVGGNEDGGCGAYEPPEWSNDFVAHAHADGSFDMSDDVAAKSARKWCPQRPTKIAAPNDILCALLWGAPAEPLGRKFEATRRACEKTRSKRAAATDGCDDTNCNSEAWSVRLAAWRPGFKLAGTTPR